jgi:hypothetical protein
MKSFRKNLSLKEERRGGTDTEKTFERSVGPLGFRTLNKKKKEKSLKNFSLIITSKNEALRKLNLRYT